MYIILFIPTKKLYQLFTYIPCIILFDDIALRTSMLNYNHASITQLLFFNRLTLTMPTNNYHLMASLIDQ
jgi:hypothetical protein